MNESATIECPWCQQNLPIPPEAAGHRVSCPFCSGKFVAEAPVGPERRPPASVPEDNDTANEPSMAKVGRILLVIGGVLLLAAAVLAYWSIYEPWEAMRRHEPSVSWSSNVRFLAVFLAVIAAGVWLWGLLQLLLCRKYTARGRRLSMDPDRGGKVLMWLLGVVAFGLALALDSWFDDQIKALGYKKEYRTSNYTPTSPPEPPIPEMPSWQETERLLRKLSPGDELLKSLDERERKSRENLEFWKEL